MKIPRVMSTQHPDNVHLPFFAESQDMSGDDEVQEAYYAFSHLGCDEQMWDCEGKEVDDFVVRKLLTRYEHFFKQKRLGEDVRLTLRLPNPDVEKNEAKVLVESLESIPRSCDAANLFYGCEVPPIHEVILPMTMSAESLNRVYYYYRDFVVGKQSQPFYSGDITISEWIGEFSPREINVIPLFEDFESACTAEGIKYHVKQEERGDPFDLMISLARYHDLMIFGLRSIFEYDISFEEPKDALARLISAGVRPIIAVSSEFRPIRKAMIAYSGSMESAKTMKRFVQLRLWDDVKLKIVTFQSSEEKARQLLYDASEYCRAHGFHVEYEWNSGYPKDFLLPMATLWQTDMIVLGNSARNLLVKRVLGETALHIIRNADRPLFLCQ